MNKKDAKELIEILLKTYPDATCSLDFKQPFEMVVAVIYFILVLFYWFLFMLND